MSVDIITQPLTLHLHGFSGIASNKDYAGVAFKLMDKMWKIVKSHELKNKGLNVWVYEPNEMVFAGVELENSPTSDVGLEHKSILLKKYAYHKHIGPYHQIRQAGQKMREEVIAKGLELTLPHIEQYGHWVPDETKLETELFMTLK